MLDKILAIIIAKMADAIWKALFLEVRVHRGYTDIAERIKVFRQHVDDIEATQFLSDEVKNQKLDNACRTLLSGMRHFKLP